MARLNAISTFETVQSSIGKLELVSIWVCSSKNAPLGLSVWHYLSDNAKPITIYFTPSQGTRMQQQPVVQVAWCSGLAGVVYVFHRDNTTRLIRAC